MSTPWRRVTHLSTDERNAVLAFLDRCESDLSREAIDENRRRAILHDRPAEHWLRVDGASLTGYAQGSKASVYEVEQAGGGVDADLLATIQEDHATVDFWVRGSQAVPDGGRSIRVIELLSIPLPVPTVPLPAGATLRPFEIGVDEERWLAQNNAAFADHPEQGAWKRDDLDLRLRDDWFDPSGFLLMFLDGTLAASCWTKIHELHRDRAGEIYVISVDPAFQGLGIGRVIVTQGLASLSRRGVRRGILFVEKTNEPARALYREIGFELVREDGVLRFGA